MAKFFQKREKPAREEGFRQPTAEEAEKFGNLPVNMTEDEIRELLRAMGKSEEEIREALPGPLPEAEQNEKLAELRKLFAAHQYKELIEKFVPVTERGLLSGETESECDFAIGFSGIMIRRRDIIERYGSHAVRYLFRKAYTGNRTRTLDSVMKMMRICEEEIPGSMQDTARRIYPILCDWFSEKEKICREVRDWM